MFAIQLAGETIGQAQVTRQGLFYHIRCRCSLDRNQIYRIVVNCNDKQEDLGVCVPTEDSFGLSTYIPVKRLGEGRMQFSVIPNHSSESDLFYPICSEEPFAYITCLQDAILVKKGGKIGAVVRTKPSAH